MSRFDLLEAARDVLEIVGGLVVTAVFLAIVLVVVRVMRDGGRRGRR